MAVAEGCARVSSDSPGVGPDGGWGWGEARNARGGEGGGLVRKEGLGNGKRSLCLGNYIMAGKDCQTRLKPVGSCTM